MNFELVSGFSVNFDKCWAFGINLDRDEISEMVGDFGCKIGVPPIPYLCLKVGGKACSSDGLEVVLQKLKRKTKKWDVKSLSLGGRITLIRSILTAIPIFTLSFRPLPKKVYNSITRLMRDFLWGNQDGAKKIAWIKWDDLYLPKTAGGLGFLNLLSFNKALLCKWIWRFLSPEISLWKRIIVSRHGLPPWVMNGASDVHPRGPSSGWWRKISSIIEGDNGIWFWNLLQRRLGDGKDTDFWKGSWTGSLSLKSRFPRLFHLSTNQSAKVSDMGFWDNNSWNWKLTWRRALRCSENVTADALLELISDHTPTAANSPDKWIWNGKPNGEFSVKTLYHELEKSRLPHSCSSHQTKMLKLLWKSTAPYKAQVHAWRLMRNRLPTSDNLRKRIHTSGVDRTCCFCHEEDESSHHLFLECRKVRFIWNGISSWIGVDWAAPISLRDHLLCFSHLLGGRKQSRNLCGLWLCIVWIWWKWRNAIIFEKENWSLHKILDEIKCRFWSWCMARGEIDARINLEQWFSAKLSSVLFSD